MDGDKLWSFHTPFRHPEAIVSGGHRDKLWSFCVSPPRPDRVQQNAETNYGHSMSCINQEEQIRLYQGGSLAERCFARTKLVSYLYFPFIPNKRQVKRGNCHTLISFGDHPLLGCDPHLTTSRYLAPIVRQFVMFRDMPEVKRRHCSTIRGVPQHVGN